MTAETTLDSVLDSLLAERRRTRTVMSSSADRAARVVREQVVEGLLRSGTRLPEERLAQALGVSRNTLREALSQLVSERILVREPNRGVVVAMPGSEDVVNVYRARRIIEPAAIRHGAERTPPRLAAVRAAVAEGRTALAQSDWDSVVNANQHFHRAIVALAGSTRLDGQMDLLLAEMRLFFHQMDRPDEFHRPYLEENAVIADLIDRSRHAEAADRLAGYLESAEHALVSSLGGR